MRTKKWLLVPLLMLIFFLAAGGTAGAAVMIPLRPALEQAGIPVSWDGKAATANLWDGRLLRVVPGSEVAHLGGREIHLEAPAVMLAGVTFVPGTLFAAFMNPSVTEHSGPSFTLVRAGELSWLVGEAVDDLDYWAVAVDFTAGGPDGNPAGPEVEQVWLLPAGNGAMVSVFLSRVDTELRTVTGNVYSLAPGADVLLKTALARDVQAVSLPVQYRIGACEVRFNPGGNNYNNMLNAVKAAEYLDGVVVPPGEVFSYNATVGPWTAKRGFVVGYAISGGRYVPARGGGVCRTSTVLYGAVLDAGLAVVERHAHSLPVEYAPLGRDATVSYGRADLKFGNNRAHAVRIEAGGTVHRLYVNLWEIVL
jgi:hypothetical protein